VFYPIDFQRPVDHRHGVAAAERASRLNRSPR
jgi:hypothetical protein